jgi:hypothetical protein
MGKERELADLLNHGLSSGADSTIGTKDNFAIGIETNDVTGGLNSHNKEVSSDITTPTDYNVMTAGPMSIASGVTVTLGAGGTWTIV